MTQPRLARRRRDAVIAAVIAIGVVVTAAVLYLGSDVRATTLDTTPSGLVPTTPDAASTVPSALRQVWQLTTDPRYGAVVTPYGTVATANDHSVSGFDATSGAPLWSYSRSNRELCAIGSGDTAAGALDAWTGVHGVMTLFAKNGYCSQVTLLDPSTGERLYQRTSPNSDPGQLFFGSPYVGWMGDDYLELWRHDLVATIRYGDQPNPVNSTGPHTGCAFSDAAVTADQLATIEHCGSTTNLVLNWPTPSDAPDKDDKGWDANHSDPKATIALDADDAVILAVTADRVAVLVGEASPSVVVYDTSGDEVSRSAADIDAADIAATARAGVTPTVTYQGRRYALVGHTLFALSTVTDTVPAPPPDETAEAGDAGESGGAGDTASDSEQPAGDAGTADSGDGEAPSTVTVETPVLDWSMPDVLGLPAAVAGTVLVPTAAGLVERDSTAGRVGETIPVDRGGYTGRVDATAVGTMVIEVRGSAVVGLAPPESDQPASSPAAPTGTPAPAG